MLAPANRVGIRQIPVGSGRGGIRLEYFVRGLARLLVRRVTVVPELLGGLVQVLFDFAIVVSAPTTVERVARHGQWNHQHQKLEELASAARFSRGGERVRFRPDLPFPPRGGPPPGPAAAGPPPRRPPAPLARARGARSPLSAPRLTREHWRRRC